MQQSQLALLFLAGQQKLLIRPDKTLGYLSWIIAFPEIQAADMAVTLVSAGSEIKESFRQTLLPAHSILPGILSCQRPHQHAFLRQASTPPLGV